MNDLETRLSAAGRSLRESAERTADVDAGWTDLTTRLHADRDGAVVVQAGDRFDHPPVQRHRWLAAAAAIVVVIGAAATFVALTDPADEPTAADPVATPTEPLFLLPAPGSGYEVSAGWVMTPEEFASASATAPARIVDVVVFGVPDGDGYTDLVTVSVSPWTGPPGPDDLVDEVREIDTAAGPATVATLTNRSDTVVQQRGDLSLAVQVAQGSEDLAVTVLERTAIIDGRPVVTDPPQGLVEIDRTSGSSTFIQTVTNFQVTGGVDPLALNTGSVSVDTAVWPVSLLAMSPGLASRVTAITIDGSSGWLATTTDYHADDSSALIWRAGSGHLVSVSGSATVEDLLRVAESLREVDEATWRTATGAGPAPTTDTTSPP